MCYHKNSSTVRSQIIFQPGNHLLIQMVRRLVQKKYVKISCQDLRKNHTSLLPSGQSVDLLIPLRDPKFRQITLHLPALRICILKCIRTDIHPLRKCRILRNKSNLQTILTNNLTLIRHFLSRNHFQKSGLSGSVNSNDPDLISLLNTERRIIKNHFLPIYFRNMFYIN